MAWLKTIPTTKVPKKEAAGMRNLLASFTPNQAEIIANTNQH